MHPCYSFSWLLKNKSGSHFKVFLPFWRQCGLLKTNLALLPRPAELLGHPDIDPVALLPATPLDDDADLVTEEWTGKLAHISS